MTVRPFYMVASIEGRETLLSGGTKQKDGEQRIYLSQRDNGEVTTPFEVYQHSIHPIDEKTGKRKHQLETIVYYQGEVLQRHVTVY